MEAGVPEQIFPPSSLNAPAQDLSRIRESNAAVPAMGDGF
jgi:hypothetical protein